MKAFRAAVIAFAGAFVLIGRSPLAGQGVKAVAPGEATETEAEVAATESDAVSVASEDENQDGSFAIAVEKNAAKDKKNTLVIPLPKTANRNNITLVDDYMDHELRIYIDSEEESFYRNSSVSADTDCIMNARCIPGDRPGVVCLEFVLDALYANESTLTKEDTIEVRLFDPSAKYEHIAVVDASYGGSETGVGSAGLYEKDVALDTALLLKDVADRNERSDLRIYYTRLSDSDADREKRMSLIRDSHADIYIELGTDYSDDTSENGLKTYYNDEFFLRRLCNADLADILERNCAARSEARAIGVLPSEDEGDILMETKIPSAKISLGNLSGSEDRGRLSDEGYKKKLAEGIYNALIGAFEVME